MLALTFQAQLDCNKAEITIVLNIDSVFLHPDVDLVNPLDFAGFSLTKVIPILIDPNANTTSATATATATATAIVTAIAIATAIATAA